MPRMTCTIKPLVAIMLIAVFACSPALADDITDAQAIHLLNRISFGPTSGDLDYIKKVGPQTYIDQQLHPELFKQPELLTSRLAAMPTLNMPVSELVDDYPDVNKKKNGDLSDEEFKAARQHHAEIIEELSEAKLLRASLSPAQLQEVMTDFWYNHFNVYAKKNATVYLVSGYERDAIRPHALGKFSDLLMATAKNMAMMIYLDNATNTQPGSPGARKKAVGINENYAREVMELHTLGVNGGYTQQDVTTLAHVLTGWGGVVSKKDFLEDSSFYFDKTRHDFSDKILLGQHIRGGGEEEVESVLNMLAHHPSTARHISYELAQYFVDDSPPQSLVDKLTSAFTSSDGDIKTVLKTLFYSPEFWAAQYTKQKFKSPFRYVVSSIRASAIVPDHDHMKKILGALDNMGEKLYFCVTPNGYADTNVQWLNSDALLKRIQFANGLVALSPQDPESNIRTALGNDWSQNTLKTVEESNEKVKGALLMSSPEFVYH